MTAIIIAIGNQKGGVGKTTTAYALGEGLAIGHNQRVLLVDCDAQASLTKATAIKSDYSLADVLRGDLSIGQIVKELRPGLLIAPGSAELSNLELSLTAAKNRTSKIREALQPAADKVDIMILDLPPSLGLLTVNGLTAADHVIIPTRATMLDIAGLSLFLETIEKAQALNQALKVMGALLTFYDPRIRSMEAIIQQLQDLDLHLFDSRIGQSIRAAEALGRSIITYSPSNPRAVEYARLSKEVYQCLKKK